LAQGGGEMTQLFLAYSINSNAVNAFRTHDWQESGLGMLASFFYLKPYQKDFPDKFPASKTILDSGAFSAWNSGKSIDIDALIEEAKKERWDEVVALDVIGDHEKSMSNALYMREKGCTVMPVFHIGEPYEVLRKYCHIFDRVGLSCRFGETEKESYAWLDQCFARQFPKGFHSFGWMNEKVLMRYPFETADSSSWAVASERYKRWKAYGGRMFIPGKHSLAPEIKFYADLQLKIKHRWKKEIERINDIRNLQVAR
jgi:hypothetical protein